MAHSHYVQWNIFFISIIIKACQAFEVCVEETPSLHDDYIYCEYSCCGYTYNRYCCENYSGVIAGAVIGSLIFLGIIIGIILCVVKKNGHRGALITPSGAPTTQHTSVAFVTSTQIQQHYTQPPPAYGVAPGYQATYNYQPLPMYAGGYPPPPAYPHDNSYLPDYQDVRQRDSSTSYPPTASFSGPSYDTKQ